MIVLDTSVLVGSLAGNRATLPAFRSAVEQGEIFLLPAIVLFEWLRGPRMRDEVMDQEALLPNEAAIPFGLPEAMIAAGIYRKLNRPRGREMDIAVASCAIARGVPLWTLNRKDFADIPGLRLASIH